MKSLIGYVSLTNDNGVMKKIVSNGFGEGPKDGDQLIIHYTSTLDDGRFLENTRMIKEPFITTLGNSDNLSPGLYIALCSMKMGENALIRIIPEYGPAKLSNEQITPHTEEEIARMEPKDAKKYSVLHYDIELIKYDKPRKNKQQMSSDEKMSEAAELKNEGNELIKQRRFNEAIVKYETGLDYISQIPTDDLTNKVLELRHQLYLNNSMCQNNLYQYSYTLKTVELAFAIKTTAKCYYYRAVSFINLDSFDAFGRL
jgi:hypothetical protein